MCEIQVVKRINSNLTQRDKREFIRLMKRGAKGNKDAFGFFNDVVNFKMPKSFNKKKPSARNIIGSTDSTFLVGHNRLATNGSKKDNRNNHPFENDGWIVVHNGVIGNDDDLKELYEFKYSEEVDSIIIPYLLEHFVKKGSKPEEAVRKTAEELAGSFSVVCYNKNEKVMYYFKNNSTDFNFGLVKDSEGTAIIGSTNEESIERAYEEFEMIFPMSKYKEKVMVEAKSEVIYKIDDNGIFEICKFDENDTYCYSYSTRKNHTSFSGWNGYASEGGYRYRDDWEQCIDNFDSRLVQIEEDLASVVGVSGIMNRRTNYDDGYIAVKSTNDTDLDEIKVDYPEAFDSNGWIYIYFEDYFGVSPKTANGDTIHSHEEYDDDYEYEKEVSKYNTP